MFVNKITTAIDHFVYPRLQDVKVLYGKPVFPKELSAEKIRKIDSLTLKNLKSILNKVPFDLLDRSDPFEYYNLLRRMTYIVSPSPIRLLTQLLITENPYDIWNWNRTTIVRKLRTLSLINIATSYEAYYLKSWDLYTTIFKNVEKFIEVLTLGWKLLDQVYARALEF